MEVDEEIKSNNDNYSNDNTDKDNPQVMKQLKKCIRKGDRICYSDFEDITVLRRIPEYLEETISYLSEDDTVKTTQSGESLFKTFNFEQKENVLETEKCIAFWKTVMEKNLEPIKCTLLESTTKRQPKEVGRKSKQENSKSESSVISEEKKDEDNKVDEKSIWISALKELQKQRLHEIKLTTRERCKMCEAISSNIGYEQKPPSKGEIKKELLDLNNWKATSIKKAIKNSKKVPAPDDAITKKQKSKVDTIRDPNEDTILEDTSKDSPKKLKDNTRKSAKGKNIKKRADIIAEKKLLGKYSEWRKNKVETVCGCNYPDCTCNTNDAILSIAETTEKYVPPNTTEELLPKEDISNAQKPKPLDAGKKPKSSKSNLIGTSSTIKNVTASYDQKTESTKNIKTIASGMSTTAAKLIKNGDKKSATVVKNVETISKTELEAKIRSQTSIKQSAGYNQTASGILSKSEKSIENTDKSITNDEIPTTTIDQIKIEPNQGISLKDMSNEVIPSIDAEQQKKSSQIDSFANKDTSSCSKDDHNSKARMDDIVSTGEQLVEQRKENNFTQEKKASQPSIIIDEEILGAPVNLDLSEQGSHALLQITKSKSDKNITPQKLKKKPVIPVNVEALKSNQDIETDLKPENSVNDKISVSQSLPSKKHNLNEDFIHKTPSKLGSIITTDNNSMNSMDVDDHGSFCNCGFNDCECNQLPDNISVPPEEKLCECNVKECSCPEHFNINQSSTDDNVTKQKTILPTIQKNSQLSIPKMKTVGTKMSRLSIDAAVVTGTSKKFCFICGLSNCPCTSAVKGGTE